MPDDSYIAQPSGTSKVLPNGSPNVGSSDIWVLAKGPDDQYVPQRWVQVQMPQERISQVISTDPQIVSGTVKSLPLPPIKSSGTPAAPTNIVQQVWMRVPSQVQQQKVYQDTVTEVANIPVPKQNIDFSPQPIKQYVQTDVVQDPQQAFVPQPNILAQKSSGFALPPPPPPTFKGGVISPTQQNVVVSQPVVYKGEDISSPKQTVLVDQPDNYKGVDVSPPNQAVIVSQPLNYKGVDINSPNQPVLINQPANYKGADSSPPKTSFLVNQPQTYKGVDITSPKQTVIVNQPVNYKGIDIAPPTQGIINQQSNYKGIDINSPNQAVIVNQPASYKGGYIDTPKQVSIVGQPQINVPLLKNTQLVKHIWIATSAQTGKFITVPVVGSVINSGKSVPPKGIPINAPPVSVSGTWVLKQDGLLPRFEPQKTLSPPVIQKGNPSTGTVIQFDSPKNVPLFGKTADSRVPVDIWANSKDFRTPTFITKSVVPAAPFPSVRAGSVVIGKTGPVANSYPQKTYISSNKGVPLQPIPPPAVAPVLQVSKGKPCIIGPQAPISPKIVPYPVYRPSIAVNRQTLPRILRINRYPYGSYYVLNPKIGPSVYAYPRPQASVIQQTKNGLVRIVPSKQIGIPQKQIFISVPRRQVAIPGNQIKTISPVLQPQFAFPAVQAFNRLRYAYPQGGFLRSLPAGAKNVFILPPSKKTRPDTLQSSSSESSSSESSESKSAESKPKSKEEIGEAKSEASPGSVESKSERETEDDVEAAASEPEPESKEASEAASEASESIEAADSEANSAS